MADEFADLTPTGAGEFDDLIPGGSSPAPPSTNRANTATDFLQGFGHMMGVGPHINAALDTGINYVKGSGSTDYGQNLDVYRRADDIARQNSPWAYGAGQVAQTAPYVAATGGRILPLVGIGAGSGAIESNSLSDVPKNALIGGVTSFVVGKGAEWAGDAINSLAQTTGGKYLSQQISQIIKEKAPGWEDKLAKMVQPVRDFITKSTQPATKEGLQEAGFNAPSGPIRGTPLSAEERANSIYPNRSSIPSESEANFRAQQRYGGTESDEALQAKQFPGMPGNAPIKVGNQVIQPSDPLYAQIMGANRAPSVPMPAPRPQPTLQDNLGTDEQIAKALAQQEPQDMFRHGGLGPQVAKATANTLGTAAVKTALGGVAGEFGGAAADYGIDSFGHYILGNQHEPSFKESSTSVLAKLGAAGGMRLGSGPLTPLAGQAAARYAAIAPQPIIRGLVAGEAANAANSAVGAVRSVPEAPSGEFEDLVPQKSRLQQLADRIGSMSSGDWRAD